MSRQLFLHKDRLFSSDVSQRDIARRLFHEVENLPIISPHGHTDPQWFAENNNFSNAAELLVQPDHYVFRMLYSQGITLDQLGIPRADGTVSEASPRDVWKLFAEHFYLFRGTPSAYWLNYVFSNIFGFTEYLCADNADEYFDMINSMLGAEEFKPRSLFERHNIELLATTESPLDSLEHHQTILSSGWGGRVITAFRPDPVVDPEFEGFADNIRALGELTNIDCSSYQGYLQALRQRREFFSSMGATSTDHGHPTARTADLSFAEADALFVRVNSDSVSAEDAELFRAQMLTEMAAMSLEDGLVMQIHPGSYRNHNKFLFANFGRDRGADIPMSTSYVDALKPLLDKFGNDPRLSIILFTLDETVYSRELGPLVGHYPVLKLGPAWWFHDSPEGMMRIRKATHEVAGFYNMVGFNDDTRAFLSIPARHDMARRIDCAHLAELVATHRLEEDVAAEIATDLAYNLAKKAYKV